MHTSNFYFRARDTNANIYRVANDSRSANRMLTQIGVIAFNSEKIKLSNGETITDEEEREITKWLKRHKERILRVQRGNAEALILQMQQTAQWVQTQANDDEIENVFEDLLLAIYDLRQAAVRRYAKAQEDNS